jgi:hypothetical protein
MNSYKLVNPTIIGNLKTEYTASTPVEAAKQFWDQLTVDNQLITNNVPKFLFTLEQDGGNLHHFMVQEKPATKKGKYASFTISEHKIDLSSEEESEFKESLKDLVSEVNAKINEQHGGRKRYHNKDDDSSSSSSSSSDDVDDYLSFLKLRRISNPLVYWLYNPVLYRVRSSFVPTFYPPHVPYVHYFYPRRVSLLV